MKVNKEITTITLDAIENICLINILDRFITYEKKLSGYEEERTIAIELYKKLGGMKHE